MSLFLKIYLYWQETPVIPVTVFIHDLHENYILLRFFRYSENLRMFSRSPLIYDRFFTGTGSVCFPNNLWLIVIGTL